LEVVELVQVLDFLVVHPEDKLLVMLTGLQSKLLRDRSSRPGRLLPRQPKFLLQKHTFFLILDLLDDSVQGSVNNLKGERRLEVGGQVSRLAHGLP